jgi:hypothetical protein
MEHTNVCVSFNGTAMGEMTLPAMKFDRGTVQFNRTIQSKFRITHPSHFALFSQDMIKVAFLFLVLFNFISFFKF